MNTLLKKKEVASPPCIAYYVQFIPRLQTNKERYQERVSLGDRSSWIPERTEISFMFHAQTGRMQY